MAIKDFDVALNFSSLTQQNISEIVKLKEEASSKLSSNTSFVRAASKKPLSSNVRACDVLSSKVSITSNSEFGRHVVAVDNIKKGQN